MKVFTKKNAIAKIREIFDPMWLDSPARQSDVFAYIDKEGVEEFSRMVRQALV